MFHPPGDCPICGSWVRKGAKACPDCGADDRSGWRDEAASDGLDLPDGDFDYDRFVENEWGNRKTPRGGSLIWWITGVILLGALLSLFFRSG